MDYWAKSLLLVAVVSVALKVCFAQTSYLCVSSCAPDGSIVGVSDSGSGCCSIDGAEGFELTGTTGSCQSCADFQSIPVSLTVSTTPSAVMLGETLTLDCMVATPPEVTATAEITWIGPNGTEVDSQSITSPTASLPIQFTPLQSADLGEYTCLTEVTSSSFPGVTTTLQGTVTLEGSSASTITESDPPTAGAPYTLTCTVQGTTGNVEWIGPDNMIITTGGGIIVGTPTSSGGVTTSTLMFSAISLDDSGRYRCRNDVTSPDSTTRTVTVGVPEPVIDIPSATTPPPTVGQPYSQTCDVSTPTSLQGDLTVAWFGPSGNQLMSAAGQNNVIALLSLPDFQSDDFGEYRCEVTVTSTFLTRTFVSSTTLDLSSSTGVDCDADPTICSLNADCVSQPEGFRCACRDGFIGDGMNCTAENCNTNPDICSADADCVDMSGTFECVCMDGFTGNGMNCTDIDECAEGTDNCQPPWGRCTNTPGGFECDCMDGFRPVSIAGRVFCLDINECQTGTDNCSPNAKCRNRLGSFRCTCNHGFVGNGIDCCRLSSKSSSRSSTSKSTGTSSSKSTTRSRRRASTGSRSSSTGRSTVSSDSEDDECMTSTDESTQTSRSRSTSRSTRSSTNRSTRSSTTRSTRSSTSRSTRSA